MTSKDRIDDIEEDEYSGFEDDLIKDKKEEEEEESNN